jgi:hypothetical protein
LLVGGTIIHSLLGLSIDKHAIVHNENNSWFEFIIIDEISMVSWNMFVTIHLKLQKSISNILSFGEMNIMFMGDFLQFPPITDKPLYSTNIQPTFAFIKQTLKKLLVKFYGKIMFILIA